MAKSSMAAAFLLLSAPAVPAAAADPVTAEQAIDRQKAQLRDAMGLDCRRDEGEIVVCGRGGADPNRVPFPDQRVEGERVRLGPSEAPNGLAGLNAGQSPCSTVGPNQRCSGGLDVVRVVTVLAKIGKHLLGGDD